MKKRQTLTITISTRPENLMIFRFALRNIFIGATVTAIVIVAAASRFVELRAKSPFAARGSIPESIVAPFQPAPPLAPAISDQSASTVIAMDTAKSDLEAKANIVHAAEPEKIQVKTHAVQGSSVQEIAEKTVASEDMAVKNPRNPSMARVRELACDWARVEVLACTVVIENQGHEGKRITGSVWAVAETPANTPGGTSRKHASEGVTINERGAPIEASGGVRFAARRLTSKILNIKIPAHAERVTVWIQVDGEKAPVVHALSRPGLARMGSGQP